MGYRAYHEVTYFPSFHKDEKHKAKNDACKVLADENASSSYFVNTYYLTSAYAPDGIEGPFDMIQEKVNESNEQSESGGDFCWTNRDISNLIKDIKKEYPNHKDTPKAIAELEAIKERDGNSGCYDFICY